ncbi:MAG TPA: hypothetical protein IAB45_03420 [Candidatus Onthousia faecavium]|nr:hypothetical protein [Candidatus Onthousia faecavium]
MNKEEKDTLIAGYWLKFVTLFNNIEKDNLQNTKDVKKLLLDGIEIIDKIIELEDDNESI